MSTISMRARRKRCDICIIFAQNSAFSLQAKSSGGGDGGVEVSLNPDELGELGEEGLKKKYEEQLRKDRGDGELCSM